MVLLKDRGRFETTEKVGVLDQVIRSKRRGDGLRKTGDGSLSL